VGGYCFVGDMREVKVEVETSPHSGVFDFQDSEKKLPRDDSQVERRILPEQRAIFDHAVALDNVSFSDDERARDTPVHLWHVLVGSALYALLCSVALVLEVSYQFNQYGSAALKRTPLVLVWIFGTSVAALLIDWKRTSSGKSRGVTLLLCGFILSALVLYAVLSRSLPATAITNSSFQSQTAQGAYLKDLCLYFLPLAIVFLALPYHFVASLQHEIRNERYGNVRGLLLGEKQAASPRNAFYINVRWLGIILLGAALFSLLLTFNLLDHIKPGPYMNLFTHLVFWRLLLFFGLGVEGLIWYSKSLNEIKRECFAELARR
jgi:hypothetical protein